MYPGSWAERSNGGVSSTTIFATRRTRCVRTESIARSAEAQRGRSGEHRPGLRDGVDAALVVLRSPSGVPSS